MEAQPSLLDWTPPKVMGSTFDPSLDESRLQGQALRVYRIFLDGKKHTLREIHELTGDPESSISARYRGLKSAGYPMHSSRLKETGGTWVYWMAVPTALGLRPMKEGA